MVTTAQGAARLHVDAAVGRPKVLLVLGHGAGGGVEARDLVALAVGLPPRGVTVVRVEQPWRVAGRRIAPAPTTLDAAWLRSVEAATRLEPAAPLVVGGRSAGARVACRCSDATAATAVLALAFPLHPPGRPRCSRADELAVDLPLLLVQGERDPFGGPAEFPPVNQVSIPAADHSFAVPRRGPITQAEVATLLVEAVAGWLSSMPGFGPRESSRRPSVLPPA